MAPGKACCYSLALAMAVITVSSSSAPLYTHSAEDRIPGHYIVVLKDQVDVGTFTRSLEASLLRGTADGKIRTTYEHAINGFAAQLSDNTVNKLRVSDEVKYIEEDGIVDALAPSSWGLGRVDQRGGSLDSYNPSFLGDGSGTHMYVIDTGTLKTHSEFTGRMSTQGFDAFGDPIGKDCNGHGTHCSGTAAGKTYGIATKATVYSVRVLGCDGKGTYTGVINGMNWVVQNANKPAVASMSLGGGKSTSVNTAVQNMVNAGVVVSVAAGNDDIDACDKSPASAPPAITVGATDNKDKRAYFSNHGSCVDIFAPGVDIKSSWKDSSSSTHTISGTSMACPHVSGAAAVLLGFNGQLTPAQVTDQLLKASTANKVTDTKSSPNKMLYVGKDTCMGRCTVGQSSGLGCQCDSGCSGRSNCCSDKVAVCGGQGNDKECFTRGTGQDYRGTKSTTKRGKTCQKWTAQSPHGHDRTPANYPNTGLGDHNYCRNPDDWHQGVWCYTTDSGTRWDLCDIGSASLACYECFTDSIDKDYRGQLSRTVSGRTCQKWTSQSPHGHSRTPANYPNAGLGDHNYCRNPDSWHEGSWCYTTDGSKRWELCNIGNPSANCDRVDSSSSFLEMMMEPTMSIPEILLEPTMSIPE